MRYAAATALVLLAGVASPFALGCGSSSKHAEVPGIGSAEGDNRGVGPDGGTLAGNGALAADAGGPPPPTWQDVELPTCGARARMTGTPKESVQSIQTDSGPVKLTILMYEAPGGAAAMGLICSESAWLKTSKMGDEHFLTQSRDGMLRKVPNGEIVTDKALRVHGFPARDVDVRSGERDPNKSDAGPPDVAAKPGQKDVFARIILMRAKGKILQVLAVGIDEAQAQEFIGSVALGPK